MSNVSSEIYEESGEIYEESGYGLDLDLLIILYYTRASFPRRSGLVGKSNHWRPIYLRLANVI